MWKVWGESLMIIKCTKCKKEFQQKKGERSCGCAPSKHKDYETVRLARKIWGENHPQSLFLTSIKRYFQDPIHQYKREQHSEYLQNPHHH